MNNDNNNPNNTNNNTNHNNNINDNDINLINTNNINQDNEAQFAQEMFDNSYDDDFIFNGFLDENDINLFTRDKNIPKQLRYYQLKKLIFHKMKPKL